MRPTLLLLASTASCASIKIGSPRRLVEEIVVGMTCGDSESISNCLHSGINLGRQDQIEQCYIAGGCPKADATAGAVWFAHNYRAEVQEEEEPQELRRRADSTQSDDSDTKTASKTSAKTTEKTTEESAASKTTESTAAASSTSVPSSAAATTTSDSTTSDSTVASTTGASTASSTTSSETTTSSSASVTSGRVTTTGKLLCSTTTTVSTNLCSTTSGTSSCVSTTTAFPTCAAGNLCTQTAGVDVCMKIDNTVPTAGIVIAIVFGTAIAAILIGIFVMSHKANAAAKVQQAESDAYLQKGMGRTHVPAASEANLPLIQNPGQDFVDYGRRAPQLHQGLGSLA